MPSTWHKTDPTFRVMPEEVAHALVSMAKTRGMTEMCGFVMKDFTVWPIRNTHSKPDQNFTMDPKQTVDIMMDKLEDVIGIYHSHPRGRERPSKGDLEGWHYPAWRYWIVTFKDVYEWRITSDNAQPIRRDGTIGLPDMAYPVLAPTVALRRTGGLTPAGSDGVSA